MEDKGQISDPISLAGADLYNHRVIYPHLNRIGQSGDGDVWNDAATFNQFRFKVQLLEAFLADRIVEDPEYNRNMKKIEKAESEEYYRYKLAELVKLVQKRSKSIRQGASIILDYDE
jgi:hypothetical protein